MRDTELRPEQLAERLLAAGAAEEHLDELRLCAKYEAARRETPDHRDVSQRTDAHDLGQTGWGVIFALGAGREVAAALGPLLERRRAQAGPLYKELSYQPPEKGEQFLLRHGETPGVVDPARLPYYLLVVGDPVAIPWKFQYALSINHAVGRLAFDDAESYRRYAEAVVAAETRGVRRPRKAALFSVENDDTTRLLAKHLAEPLRAKWRHLGSGWELEVRRREKASKAGLQQLLSGMDAPGLLLASCHGVSKVPGDADQERLQGSLVCQDKAAFSGGDVDGCPVEGLTVMSFACFGAGTPVLDNFPEVPGKRKLPAVALRPFVARLPQALLARGALAVVGHVDRGWTLSFVWWAGDRAIPAVHSLDDVLFALTRGDRLGHALRPLHQRYKALAAQLAAELELQKNPLFEWTDEARERLAFKWMAHNDARNFVLLGDPAVYVLGRRADARPWLERQGRSPWARLRSRPSFPKPAPAAEGSRSPGEAVADLEIRVVRDTARGEDAIRFEVTARDPELDLNAKRFGPVATGGDPRRFLEPFFAEISTFSPEDPESAREAEEKIAGSGATLANRLLPADLRELLDGLHRRGRAGTLLIQSEAEADWIPWELLKLEPGPFLCEAFAVSRWQGEVGFRGRLHLPLSSMAFLSPHDAGLPAVAAEYAGMEALLAEKGRTLQGVESTYNSVVAQLGEGRLEGWHFAGHALAGGEPSFWAIDLGKGGKLRPKDLSGKASGFAKARPLVFFNGCHTGQAGRSIGRAGGWAAQWMELGAGAFVGTSWAVRDASAAAFAQVFYESFLAGASLAEAAREARRTIRRQFPGDPTWLTYVVYGHPAARCAPKPTRVGRFLLAAFVAVLLVFLSLSVIRGGRHRRFVEHNDRGIARSESGDLEGAARAFQAALEIKDAAQAHANLGLVYARQSRWLEALESFDEAVALEPEVASFRFNKGSVLLHVRRIEEAVQELRRAVDLDPSYAEAYNELGRAFLMMGRPEEARRWFEAGLGAVVSTADVPPDIRATLRKNFARLLLEEGDAARAIEELEAALHSYGPDNPQGRMEATYLLGKSYAQLGEIEQTCGAVRRFMRLDNHLVSTWAPAVGTLAEESDCPIQEGGAP